MIRTLWDVGESPPKEGPSCGKVAVMVRRKSPPPRSWLASGDFPTGRLTKDAPVEAVAAQSVAKALSEALEADGRPLTAIASEAGVSRSTVYGITAGESYPDFSSIARLAAVLEVELWPFAV
jgi:DNA-binding phage protein